LRVKVLKVKDLNFFVLRKVEGIYWLFFR